MLKQKLSGVWKPRIRRVLAVTAIAGPLVLLESCAHPKAAVPEGVPLTAMQPPVAPVAPPPTPLTAPPVPLPPPPPNAQVSRLPDPRYRRPVGLHELEGVASTVGRASGSAMRGQIVLGPETGPLCGIRGSMDNAIIRVHPRGAGQIPPNSWAFIFGHEFAHQTQHIAQHGDTSPALELRADIVGAEYARKAGFDLAAHLGWIMSCRDQYSSSHGDWHARAQATARHFGISPDAILIQTELYRRVRW